MKERLKVLIPPVKDRVSNRFIIERHIDILKSALDRASIDYTFSKKDNFDIVHLFSYDQYKEFKSFRLSSEQKKAPVIMEAFVDNNDIAMIEQEEGGNLPSSLVLLKPETLKAYNDVDYIIVNHLSEKTLLRLEEVETRVVVLNPCSDDLNKEEITDCEKRAFRSFHKLKDTDKIVVCMGSYSNYESIDIIVNLARIMPNYEFFFYGINENSKVITHFQRVASKVLNLHFVLFGFEELYRSMLYNTDLLILTNPVRLESLNILDFMKAKIPVISVKNELLYEIIEDEKTALIYKDFKDLYDKVKNIDNVNCVDSAYSYASKFTMDNYVENLKHVYESSLNMKKNKEN